MSTLGIIAACVILVPFYAYLAWAAVDSVRCYMRLRAARPVEPSPLIQEITEWLGARERTFARQSIFEVPSGKTRLGIDAPAPRKRPGA